MRRLALIGSLCVVLALSSLPGGATTSHAEPQKKTDAEKKKGGNKDLKNTVDGALWRFIATNRDGKRIRFQYRATNYVLYNPDTNAVIGKTVNAGKKKAQVTFNSKSEFPESFLIELQENGYWTARADHDKQSWDIQLKAIDR